MTFTIDDPQVTTARLDTVAGDVRVEDADGVDSVWVTLETVETGYDGGFHRVVDTRYRFVVSPGFTPGTPIPLLLRARDIAGFEVQRDTYVVVTP